jgi:hypothetical protein
MATLFKLELDIIKYLTEVYFDCSKRVGAISRSINKKPIQMFIDVEEALIYHYNPYCDEPEKGLMNDTNILKYKTLLYNFIESYKLSKWFL